MEKIKVRLGKSLIDGGVLHKSGSEVSLHKHTYDALHREKFEMTRVYDTQEPAKETKKK